MAKKKPATPTKDIDNISLEVWKEYRGDNFAMFIEAIKSGCLAEHSGRIENYMKLGDAMRLGTTIMNAVNSKVDSWANDEIAKRYNDGLGGGDEQN